MPDVAPSPETFFKAFGLLSHLYLTPVLRALIEGRVPDHLYAGPSRRRNRPRGPGCTH